MLKKILGFAGKKVYDTITNVKPFVPKNKKEILERDLRRARQKRKTSEVKLDNTIFRINQQKKRLEDKLGPGSANPRRPGKMGGGLMSKRVGLKRGTGLMQKKSNVQKIKETFATKKDTQSRMTKKKKKFPDLTGDGKVTFADILKGRGVKRG